MFILECGKNHLGKKQEAKKILDFFLKSSVNDLSFMCQSQKWYHKKLSKGKSFKLNKNFYIKALDSAHRRGKKIGLSVCDLKSLKDLGKINFDFYKLLSVAISDKNLCEYLIKKNKPIYISTGFNASIKKIVKCMQCFKNFKKKILLHTPMVNKYNQLKFNKINLFRKKFKVPVGYSNHFHDINTLLALSAYKPKVIMIYVKPSKKLNVIYPDDHHAIYLNEVEIIKQKYENIRKSHR